MANFEGAVSLTANKGNGVPTIIRDADGAWGHDNVQEFLEKIIEVGKGLSTYSLWVDKTPKPKYPANGCWSAKQLQGFLKDATEVQLVAVRRQNRKTGSTFRAPVIRIGYGQTKAASNKLL
jgi:hypothetical protein